MIVQLNPPLPVEANGRKGMAWFLIDYGTEFDLVWVIAYDDTGEFWCVRNPLVRAQSNITFGRLPHGAAGPRHPGA